MSCWRKSKIAKINGVQKGYRTYQSLGLPWGDHLTRLDLPDLADMRGWTKIIYIQNSFYLDFEILKWPILNTYQSLLFRKATSVGTSCFSDVSASTFRPLIPLSFRKTIFEHGRFLGHPGIHATRRLISSQFLWPGNRWPEMSINGLGNVCPA